MRREQEAANAQQREAEQTNRVFDDLRQRAKLPPNYKFMQLPDDTDVKMPVTFADIKQPVEFLDFCTEQLYSRMGVPAEAFTSRPKSQNHPFMSGSATDSITKQLKLTQARWVRNLTRVVDLLDRAMFADTIVAGSADGKNVVDYRSGLEFGEKNIGVSAVFPCEIELADVNAAYDRGHMEFESYRQLYAIKTGIPIEFLAAKQLDVPECAENQPKPEPAPAAGAKKSKSGSSKRKKKKAKTKKTQAKAAAAAVAATRSRSPSVASTVSSSSSSSSSSSASSSSSSSSSSSVYTDQSARTTTKPPPRRQSKFPVLLVNSSTGHARVEQEEEEDEDSDVNDSDSVSTLVGEDSDNSNDAAQLTDISDDEESVSPTRKKAKTR
jgi:hypothetical protein